MPPKTKVLWVAANPNGTATLEIQREIEGVRQKAGDGFDFIDSENPSVRRLVELLETSGAEVLHFSGHHSRGQGIVLRGESGSPQPVADDAMQELLKLKKRKLRLVVLNACFTKSLAERLKNNVECVVGTLAAVRDSSAVEFSQVFFRQLQTNSVSESLQTAKVVLQAEQRSDFELYDMYWAPGVDPEKLFLAGLAGESSGLKVTAGIGELERIKKLTVTELRKSATAATQLAKELNLEPGPADKQNSAVVDALISLRHGLFGKCVSCWVKLEDERDRAVVVEVGRLMIPLVHCPDDFVNLHDRMQSGSGVVIMRAQRLSVIEALVAHVLSRSPDLSSPKAVSDGDGVLRDCVPNLAIAPGPNCIDDDGVALRESVLVWLAQRLKIRIRGSLEEKAELVRESLEIDIDLTPFYYVYEFGVDDAEDQIALTTVEWLDSHLKHVLFIGVDCSKFNRYDNVVYKFLERVFGNQTRGANGQAN